MENSGKSARTSIAQPTHAIAAPGQTNTQTLSVKRLTGRTGQKKSIVSPPHPLNPSYHNAGTSFRGRDWVLGEAVGVGVGLGEGWGVGVSENSSISVAVGVVGVPNSLWGVPESSSGRD